jgi:hypothetical protein
MEAHMVAPHLPLVQSRLQQSVGTLHAIPSAAHMPPATMQVLDTGSHEEEQHCELEVQTSPLGPQESMPPSVLVPAP